MLTDKINVNIRGKMINAKIVTMEEFACINFKDHSAQKCNNPVDITITQWISNSRQYDNKYSIYDPDRFIDRYFLECQRILIFVIIKIVK